MLIPGFANYDITEDGVVTNVKTNRVIKHAIMHDRATVCLSDSRGMYHGKTVLRLLLQTFSPVDNDALLVARAKDGNYRNTALSNAYWDTRHATAQASYNPGQRHRVATTHNEASAEMLLTAMEQYAEPVSATTLSVDLQVPYATVRYTLRDLLSAGKIKKTNKRYEVIR